MSATSLLRERSGHDAKPAWARSTSQRWRGSRRAGNRSRPCFVAHFGWVSTRLANVTPNIQATCRTFGMRCYGPWSLIQATRTASHAVPHRFSHSSIRQAVACHPLDSVPFIFGGAVHFAGFRDQVRPQRERELVRSQSTH